MQTHKTVEVIVDMQHNLRVDVGDNAAIFGMKLVRTLDSIKSNVVAKKININIFGHLSARFNLNLFLVN